MLTAVTSNARPIGKVRSLQMLCSLVCFLLLASNVWSMSRWNEARGVYDDVCYLRQAHLFQRLGLGGFDTDIFRDDDQYLPSKLKEIGFQGTLNVEREGQSPEQWKADVKMAIELLTRLTA